MVENFNVPALLLKVQGYQQVSTSIPPFSKYTAFRELSKIIPRMEKNFKEWGNIYIHTYIFFFWELYYSYNFLLVSYFPPKFIEKKKKTDKKIWNNMEDLNHTNNKIHTHIHFKCAWNLSKLNVCWAINLKKLKSLKNILWLQLIKLGTKQNMYN